MQFADDHHAADDVLERYSMDRLAGPELAEFEEHLLVCESCQDRLACEDRIRQRVREGAAALQRPRAAALWRSPRLGWAIGLAAVGLVVVAQSQRFSLPHSSAQPAVIPLQTMRGTENPTQATAPAGRPLVVVLDLTDLQQFSEYTLEVVDAGGRSVFQSSEPPQNNTVQATLPRGLAAGVYFVRVYTPARQLLREYALTVRA